MVTNNENQSEPHADSSLGLLDIEAADVTGKRSASARGVDRSTPAGTLARALADGMNLPTDTPWAIRNNNTGALLDEAAPIGRQLGAGAKAKVVMTPRTHLGAGA
ncbi:MAG: hypothetical protein HKO57_09210 [Akkermansiaceae bacterium]|nr:hypothetical protein [Akkermansiaceae bacterium]